MHTLCVIEGNHKITEGQVTLNSLLARRPDVASDPFPWLKRQSRSKLGEDVPKVLALAAAEQANQESDDKDSAHHCQNDYQRLEVHCRAETEMHNDKGMQESRSQVYRQDLKEHATDFTH